MFSLSLLLTPPPENVAGQVQKLAIDHLTLLGNVSLAPSNPLYPLYQYGLGLEVHHYLQAIGGDTGLQVELLLALDEADPTKVLGFALYLPAQGAADACTLLYLVVVANHRGRGIGKALLKGVMARYPHTEAACALAVVDWFEMQGWHVSGARGPQVVVNTRAVGTLGEARLLDVAPLYRTLEVQQIHTYLLKQLGRRAMVQAEKQRDYRLDQLERQAAAYAAAQRAKP
jgi:GNAT superfamily N-acetyltransferase